MLRHLPILVLAGLVFTVNGTVVPVRGQDTPPVRITCEFVPSPLTTRLAIGASVRVPREAHAIRLPGAPIRLALSIANRERHPVTINLCALSELVLLNPRGEVVRIPFAWFGCDRLGHDFIVIPPGDSFQELIQLETDARPRLQGIGWFLMHAVTQLSNSALSIFFIAINFTYLSKQLRTVKGE